MYWCRISENVCANLLRILPNAFSLTVVRVVLLFPHFPPENLCGCLAYSLNCQQNFSSLTFSMILVSKLTKIINNFCCRRAKRGDNSILWTKSPHSDYFIKLYYINTRVQNRSKKWRCSKSSILGSKKKQKVAL